MYSASCVTMCLLDVISGPVWDLWKMENLEKRPRLDCEVTVDFRDKLVCKKCDISLSNHLLHQQN